jgi:hypothetical protein
MFTEQEKSKQTMLSEKAENPKGKAEIGMRLFVAD